MTCEKRWGEMRRAEMRWDEVRRAHMIWDEMKCGVWSASVKCEVRGVKSAVWSVKKVFAFSCIPPGSRAGHVLGQQHRNSFAQSTHAGAWLAHGACKFYRWERSCSITLRQLPPRLVGVLLVYILRSESWRLRFSVRPRRNQEWTGVPKMLLYLSSHFRWGAIPQYMCLHLSIHFSFLWKHVRSLCLPQIRLKKDLALPLPALSRQLQASDLVFGEAHRVRRLALRGDVFQPERNRCPEHETWLLDIVGYCWIHGSDFEWSCMRLSRRMAGSSATEKKSF